MSSAEPIPCRVINLATRPERLAHMTSECARFGIRFARFDAIDPTRRYNFTLPSMPRRRGNRDWTNIEVGCLLSHYELWHEIAVGSAKHVAIFEDDVVLSDLLPNILTGDFPPDADIVKLDTSHQVLYLGRRFMPLASGRGGFRRLLSNSDSTGAYIVSRSAAAKLAEALQYFDAPVDSVLFSPKFARILRLVVYQTVPAAVIQGEFLDRYKSSATMLSSRAAQGSTDERVRGRLSVELIFRMMRRAWRQLHGIREKVRFVGD